MLDRVQDNSNREGTTELNREVDKSRHPEIFEEDDGENLQNTAVNVILHSYENIFPMGIEKQPGHPRRLWVEEMEDIDKEDNASHVFATTSQAVHAKSNMSKQQEETPTQSVRHNISPTHEHYNPLLEPMPVNSTAQNPTISQRRNPSNHTQSSPYSANVSRSPFYVDEDGYKKSYTKSQL